MTRLVFDLDELARAVDRMRLFQQHLVRTHDTVQQRVAALHVEWSGEAAAAHAAAQQQWASASREVHDALADLVAVVATAHANYSAAVATNRRMWAQ